MLAAGRFIAIKAPKQGKRENGKMEKVDKAKEFFSEARVELKKVTWPPKKQTIQATWVVIVMVIIISIFLGGVDLIFSSIIKSILGS